MHKTLYTVILMNKLYCIGSLQCILSKNCIFEKQNEQHLCSFIVTKHQLKVLAIIVAHVFVYFRE